MVKKVTNLVEYGVWIDHKKAIIGYFNPEGEFIHETIYSGIETRVRFKGETTDKIRFGTSKRTRQTQKQNKLSGQLKKFCSTVVSYLVNRSAVLIVGPADAKLKLAGILKNDKSLKDVWIKVAPADKMKLSEFKAVVMAHYV